MPPARVKLHNKTGKLKNISPISAPPTVSGSELPSTQPQSRDSEADQLFEVELCWCIHQLENSLINGKLNQKQTQDTEKAIKILKSGNQPIIKKRQLMRSTFGDYRAKMLEEEKKMLSTVKKIRFNDKATSTNSFFVKKSAILTSGKDFKFNFPVEELEQLTINGDQSQSVKTDSREDTNSTASAEFHFVPSQNTFRFNFAIEDAAS